MKACEVTVRLLAPIVVVCGLASFGGQTLQAQIAVSPPSVSFGVPTGAAKSAPEKVTFTVTPGEGIPSTVKVSSITFVGGNNTEFSETDNCGTPFSVPGACTIYVTFTPTTGLLPGFLQTTTLTISSNAPTATVPLSGAVGAIKLFDALDINQSLPNTPDFPGRAVKSTTVTLACPTSGPTPQGTLSSSPDGLNNVFQDNYIRATIVGAEKPAQNVCTGGATDANLNGGSNGTNCFQTAYESVASNFLGQDPDIASVGEGTFVGNYGVSPLLVTPLLTTGTQSITFELVDVGLSSNPSGAFLGASSLHLATNCMLVGVQTNGVITSDPIDPNKPGSLTPEFTFNSTPNQHISFDANYLGGLTPSNQVNFPSGTVAQLADRGIPQSDFPALVAGTSAGPAICLRYAGEKAADNVTQLCKAFTIQCTNAANPTPAGVNCPNSVVRSLLYESRFDSPDFLPNTNPIAPGTGPGFLMGPDIWNTVSDCVFTAGPEATQKCPQNPLTVFRGAADPTPGGTPRGVNSTFIPVLNMPLPSTRVAVTTDSFFEWQNTPTVKVKFSASPATYSPTAQRPANGFIAAPIQSVTFGTSPANTPLPDTTFPIPTDTTLFNGGGSVDPCPTAPAGTFNTSATFNLTEGRYRLHYFATDCANTEELRFIPSTDPNANWATFKSEELNIDTSHPVIPVLTLSNTTPAAGQRVTATFECKDPVLADGNPGSGVIFCGPFFFFAVADTEQIHLTFTASGSGAKTFSVTAIDLAGNLFTVSAPYTVH
jgi:hypothetical protein